MDVALLAVLSLSYLFGSFPTGFLIGRFVARVNVLQRGSRRTGATNVLRVAGWRAALAVVLGDAGKGVLAVAAARAITQGDPMGDLLAGSMALAGHSYSPFLGFKGGRGVATGAATVVFMVPLTLPVGMALFVVTTAATRYVSLGSLLAALSVPPTLLLIMVAQGLPVPHLVYGVLASAFVVLNHRDNLGRLLAGTERRLGDLAAD